MCGRRLRGKFCWKDEEFLGRSIVRWLAARQSPFDISLLRGPLLILLYFHQIDRPNDLLLCRDLLAPSYCSLSIFHVALFSYFPPNALPLTRTLPRTPDLLPNYRSPPPSVTTTLHASAARNNVPSKLFKIHQNKTSKTENLPTSIRGLRSANVLFLETPPVSWQQRSLVQQATLYFKPCE